MTVTVAGNILFSDQQISARWKDTGDSHPERWFSGLSYVCLFVVQKEERTMFGKRFSLLCVAFLSLCIISLAGCGGIAAIGVAITPSAQIVDGTDTVTLTATVSNDHNAAGVTWTLSGGGALSNTTTTSATYTAPAATSTSQSVTITATSIGDTSKSASVTLTVAAAPSITTAGPLNGVVGTAYSVSLAASGGIAPYTWTVASGSALPNGVTLSSSGQIAGIPPASAAGTTAVTFNLRDSGTPNALTASKSISFIIAPAPALSFVGVMPTTATINTSFSGSAQASGGAGTLTYNLVSGSLPTGTSLNTSTGAVTGTVTAAGAFTFTIGVADAFGDVASNAYTVTVGYPAMSITTASPLAAGYVNGNYSQSLAATGGSNNAANYTWSISGGTSLPAGLSLSSAGVISGKPTGAPGTTVFTAQVSDSVSGLSTTKSFSITVNAGVSITTGSSLATGYTGSNYSVSLNASGGTGTGYIWTVTSGSSLPAGLTLSSAGLLSGQPTAAAANSFNITVTDSAANTANQTFSLTVNAGVSITSSNTLPKGYQGAAYPGATLTASGGSGTGYSWTWAPASGSSIPSGLTLSPSGVVAGTPATSGTFSIVVTVTDSVSNTASATVSLTVEAALAISPSTLPSGTVNVAYSQTLSATGGSGTGYTWASLGNTNPALGLALSAGGVISGTPTVVGSTTITAEVTDSGSHTASVPLTVTVYNALTVTTTTLPSWNQGVAYSQTLAAAGGSGSGYTWSTTTSNLASFGLNLSAAGVVNGTPTQTGTATFTAQVTDSSSNTATQSLSIQVYGALSLPASNSLPSGYTNVAYTGAITGSGGSGTLSISITSALAPSNGTLATSISSNTVNITGTPTTATTETLTVKLTDSTTSNFITQAYSFVVNTATAPSLPVLTLPAATVSQAYSQNITATGGVGPTYTWTVNSSAVPTNGSAVSLGSGITVSNTGNNVLTIGGTPNASGTVNFTAQVKDNTTNLTSGTQNYSITVNSSGYQVSGTVALSNICGNLGLTPPAFTFSINTTSPQQVQSNNGGNYTFSSIPNGTYTITPSYAGPSGSSAMFYPASASVTVNDGTVTVPTFMVALGYTVSGTATYAGSHTGPIYLNLINSNCGSSGGSGTSITSPGSFTIRGVSPGNYTLLAWQDPTDLSLGQGIRNSSDPQGTATVNVLTTNYSSANVTLTNNDPSAVPSQAPTLQAIFGTHTGVVMAYSPAKNGNNIETATSYDVAWSTSPTLTSGALSIAGQYNYKANGEGTVWILNNGITGSNSFTDGTTYYFMARANNSAGHGPWTVYGSGTPLTPTGVTVNPPSGAATISGNVTIPAGVTVGANAKLYVGFFSNSAGINSTIVNSPAVGSNNPFTVNVPTGTWQFFAILDQNNDGQIDTGDVSNTRTNVNGPPTVTISGSGTQNVTLVNSANIAVVETRYSKFIGSGGTGTDYAFDIGIGPSVKLPISVQLTAASNPNVLVPMDLSNYCQGCSDSGFRTYVDIHNDTPAVGDTYTFTIKYSDGTTDSAVTAAVTGWNGTGTVVGPGALATNLLPSGATGPSAGTRTQPTFSWTYPSDASTAGDRYYFSLCCNANNDIWDIPRHNSNSDGFAYSQAPGGTITWNVDPSGSGSTPTLSNLTVGTEYSWAITANDSNGNTATTGTYYIP